MINWNEIKDKYPKAWMLLKKWWENELDCTFGDEYADLVMNTREFYDFFDQNELWIEISSQAINNWSFNIFKLTDDNFDCIFSENSYKLSNRIEAEGYAFYKAFELLEKKLKY